MMSARFIQDGEMLSVITVVFIENVLTTIMGCPTTPSIFSKLTYRIKPVRVTRVKTKVSDITFLLSLVNKLLARHGRQERYKILDHV